MLIRSRRRWLGLIAVGLALGGLAVAMLLGAVWYDAFTLSPSGRWLRFRLVRILLAGFLVACAVVPAGLVASAVVGIRARRQGDRRLASRSGKVVLLSLSLLAGMGLSELVCAWRIRGLAKLVHPPAFANSTHRPTAAQELPEGRRDASPLKKLVALDTSAASSEKTIDLVIIGGSSAYGFPFAPGMSLDRIIAWQLCRAFPDRTVRTDNRAAPGLILESAIEKLVGLERRPDLLIIYSGQNEFQSRFGWLRTVDHYRRESKVTPLLLARQARKWSSVADLLGRDLDRFEAALASWKRDGKDPVDAPCCTPAEYAAILADYRLRLDGLLNDCDAAGILTMVVVPPSNDGDFDPNRSILPPDTSRAERRAFAARLDAVIRGEKDGPAEAIEGYRRLIAEQPGFAETHFRLAELLEAAGLFDEAREEYTRARDLDALPIRCPTPFLEVCRELGRRHHSIVLDASRLLALACPHGILDDRMFNDAHHPSLGAFAIMARHALRLLKGRRAFGWPEDSPAPSFTIADCVARFRLGQEVWISICKGSHLYYALTAGSVRDPARRQSVAARYKRAMSLLEAGKSPDETGIPALKIHDEPESEVSPIADAQSGP
jgi:hypothetical protein